MSHRLGLFVLVACLGCASTPAIPESPSAVVALTAEYDRPTAVLTAAAADALIDDTRPLRRLVKIFSSLRFMRAALANAMSISTPNIDSLDVQGALDARAACPGWSDTTPPDPSIDGIIELTIGIDNSYVQRAFTGRVVDCRFVTAVASGALSNGIVNMNVEVDLGGDLPLGEPTASLLVRATELSGAVGGSTLELDREVLSFRLLADGTVETLVDLGTLERGLSGTALVSWLADGSWKLQASNDAWVCSDKGQAQCSGYAPAG